ncbi:hypothetical protein K438DRAFT_2011330 [Mycena galopus ATCC 62051]|nr:hypothetical protein K438DRAFT_2011330 [Mycena galopus ATCC 62051]
MSLIRRLPFDIAPQIFTPRCIDTNSPSATGKGPKVYKIKLTLVTEINPEALNVVIRMQPSLSYPYNVCSFADRDIGAELELCEVRVFPVFSSRYREMLINVDIYPQHNSRLPQQTKPAVDAVDFPRSYSSLATNREIRNPADASRCRRCGMARAKPPPLRYPPSPRSTPSSFPDYFYASSTRFSFLRCAAASS